MKMHGLFFAQQAKIPQMDMDQSAAWLTCGHLRGKIEVTLCTAMEQTLVTNNKARFGRICEEIYVVASRRIEKLLNGILEKKEFSV
eukprot:1998566-Ditylum_brightwellii.AAC.1